MQPARERRWIVSPEYEITLNNLTQMLDVYRLCVHDLEEHPLDGIAMRIAVARPVAQRILLGAVPPLPVVVVQDPTASFRNRHDSAVRGTLGAGAGVGERFDGRQIRIGGTGVALIAAAAGRRAGRDGAPGERSAAVPAPPVVSQRGGETAGLPSLVHRFPNSFPTSLVLQDRDDRLHHGVVVLAFLLLALQHVLVHGFRQVAVCAQLTEYGAPMDDRYHTQTLLQDRGHAAGRW